MKTTLRPVPFTRVDLEDRFWRPRQQANRRVTIPHSHELCRKTGRLDAWTWKPGQPNEPHIFWDSDVAKWIEAAAYALAGRRDRALERKIDAAVERMARGQQADGYLNSHFSRVEPAKRWTNLRDWHELYCAGHLIEAAVAYFHATGKRRFLDIMCRYAEHIGRVFGRGRGQKRGVPGHEEIELALVKLYRATGERRHLDLASYFIDERGRRPCYFDVEAKARGEAPGQYWARSYAYCQAHEPVRDQSDVVGHAVRAMYLYCGMADVAAETGDKALLAACRRLWDSVTTRRLHVTGGIGPTCRNEGFTFDYDLPNESAYDETCAAIGLVFWAHRMFHLDRDGRYIDVMERALYNAVPSGVSPKGDRFFYANPLAAHPGVDPHGSIVAPDFHYRRSEWFGCACCPPNVARLAASLGEYAYSSGPGDVVIHLYMASRARVAVGGQEVRIEQRTDYPWDGRVRLRLAMAKPASFALSLRIPGWARSWDLSVNGRRVRCPVKKGYVSLRREWKSGDRLTMEFPMPVERIEAHPAVRQDAGRVAIQRGPVIFCLEEVDNGPGLADLRLPGRAPLRAGFDRKVLGGVVVITGDAIRRDVGRWGGRLYQADGSAFKRCRMRAIPYALWANRKPGEMAVWIQGDGAPRSAATIRSSSS